VPAPAPTAPPASDLGEDEAGAAGTVTDDWIKQSTVTIEAQVKQRFKDYQEAEKPTPSNVEVVFAALNACDGRYAQVIQARKPQMPEGQRFGRAVPGRRTGPPVLTTQLNYRPTVGEEKEIKRLSRASGATSMSAFINAVLDAYLPPAAPARKKRGGAARA
jgi:hypothetical protein